YLAMTGVFGGSLYFLFENTALQWAQASDVSILVSASPIFTSIVLAIFYKSERISLRQTLGMIIAFIGMIFIVLNGQFILHVSVWGYLLAIASAGTWAMYNLFMKKVMSKYSSQFISRKVFFYGLLSILPYYGFVSPLQFEFNILSQTAVWGCLLFLGLLASMYCYVLWNTAMANIGAVKTTVYLYMAPLFTMITAYIILGERITWMAVMGTVILLTGMVMAEKKSKKGE
ncbi:MAG: DMT family transporter, partial [Bacteroidaceae bacterium]|nr:DMT family transporter [Bacteroidaceae bacterium]